MNNQIILENYLLILKSTVEVYIHGTLESSTKDVRKLLSTLLNETLEHQEKTFKLMVENNLYSIENTSSSNINKVYNKICKDN